MPGGTVVVFAVMVLMMAGLSFGCSKSPKAAAPVPAAPVQDATAQTNPAAAPSAMPSPAPSAASPSLTTANGSPDLGELNRCLVRWIVKNRRRPANFEDFAATAGVAIPPPPAGQKYILGNNMHIQLVGQ